MAESGSESDTSSSDVDVEPPEEPIEEAIQNELERQLEEARQTLVRKMGKDYNQERFERIAEHPYFRQVLMGSRGVAEHNIKKRKEAEARRRQFQKDRKKNRISIFNAYDTIIGRIPQFYQQRLKETYMRDSSGKIKKRDHLVFPDPSVLLGEGFLRMHELGWTPEQLEKRKMPPCFYPVYTQMKSRQFNAYTKAMRDEQLDRLSSLGNRGPLGSLPRGHWSLMFCSLPPSFESLFRSLRSLQTEELHNYVGEPIKGDAFQYSLRLCPVPNFYQELYTTMGNHVILREELENQGFTEDLISQSFREGFRPMEELETPEPSLEEDMADLLDILFDHFKIKDRSNLQPLLTKVMDYLVPGVLEVLKS